MVQEEKKLRNTSLELIYKQQVIFHWIFNLLSNIIFAYLTPNRPNILGYDQERLGTQIAALDMLKPKTLLITTFILLTLFIPGFFGWCSTGGGGVFSTSTLVTPLSLKSRRVKFRTELLWGRINILGQEKLGSNR